MICCDDIRLLLRVVRTTVLLGAIFIALNALHMIQPGMVSQSVPNKEPVMACQT